MAKFKLVIYLVAIATTNSGDSHVPRFFKISEDRLGASLSYSDSLCDISDPGIRVAAEVNENMAVIREEGPFTHGFSFWLH